jgi:sensor domain CHASE-containing protein
VSDFVLSILVSIGIVVIALGIVTWITLRRVREEEARTE